MEQLIFPVKVIRFLPLIILRGFLLPPIEYPKKRLEILWALNYNVAVHMEPNLRLVEYENYLSLTNKQN